MGLPTVDDHLQFVGARGRPDTWLATAYNLLGFFSVIPKHPADVTTADVFAFLEAQRSPPPRCPGDPLGGSRTWPGGAHDQTTAGQRLGAVRIPRRTR